MLQCLHHALVVEISSPYMNVPERFHSWVQSHRGRADGTPTYQCLYQRQLTSRQVVSRNSPVFFLESPLVSCFAFFALRWLVAAFAGSSSRLASFS